MSPTPAGPAIPSLYQLRVVLHGISPLIWRRLLVPTATSVAELHTILQTAFGWSGEHLHRFVVHGTEYGVDHLGGPFRDDARRVRLAELGLRITERFTYHYNFTAGWEVNLRLEHMASVAPGRSYPRCTGGRRAGPPQDWAGPLDYLERTQPYLVLDAMLHAADIIGRLLDADEEDDLASVDVHRHELATLAPLLGLERFDRRALNHALAALPATPGEGGMKLTVHVTLSGADDNTETVVREVFALKREALTPDTLGLGLAEAKDLLAAVQDTLVTAQVSAAVAVQDTCPDCATPYRHKDKHTIVVRSLFGTLRLDSPRWWHCGCQPQTNRTFSPLTWILPERTTPELSYLQARFAGLVSFGASASLLSELLPLGRPLHATALRLEVHATAQRLEDELGDERSSFIDTCQRDREELPRPQLPLVVGLDGGYVHSSQQRSRRDGWFEVIAGKAVSADGRATCFGYVQTYDTKPKRRLFEVLKAQGMTENQQVTFLTDGGEDIRELPCYLNPDSEHLLDWFHITMRITVMTNMTKSLRPPPPDPDLELSAETAIKLITEIGTGLERLKWLLWHGNVFRALQTVIAIAIAIAIAIDLETLNPDGEPTKLLKAVREFDSYLSANAGRIPNYGERHRAGEAISTAFVESTVNQVISKRMVKKQQMRWTPRGAHLLLQIRTRVLNDTLTNDYRRWYPGFTHSTSEADTLGDQLLAA